MSLTLSIVNLDRLPDGGPLTFSMRGQRRVEIGREAHLDWSLPDPQRFISGKHCEIQLEGSDYLLFDVSRNGTFVNGSPARVQSPYRLKNGDSLQIGEYLIAVALDGASAAEPAHAEIAPISIDRAASYDSLWDVVGEAPPPIDPKALKPQPKRSPVYADFLLRAADLPSASAPAEGHAPDRSAADVFGYEEPAHRVPEPRRRQPAAELWDAAPAAGARTARPENVEAEGPQAEPAASSQPAPIAPARAAAAPVAAATPTAGAPAGDAAWLSVFAREAGLPADFFATRNPAEIAAMLGATMRLMTEELQSLLQARVQAKRLARSAEHTIIEARENNPLKFSPTAEDALRIMLGPPTQTYLGAQAALAQTFGDLKSHQVQTYSAMQKAVAQMMSELDPGAIERKAPAGGGVAGLIKSRKGELWDAYVALWTEKSGRGAEDLIQKFMNLFGSFYDSAGQRR